MDRRSKSESLRGEAKDRGTPRSQLRIGLRPKLMRRRGTPFRSPAPCARWHRVCRGQAVRTDWRVARIDRPRPVRRSPPALSARLGRSLNAGLKTAHHACPRTARVPSDCSQSGFPSACSRSVRLSLGGFPSACSRSVRLSRGGFPIGCLRSVRFSRDGLPIDCSQSARISQSGFPSDCSRSVRFSRGGLPIDRSRSVRPPSGDFSVA
jgi:hypothetical protein